ncbi:hypothetical protein R3P38DRAFT_3292326 [Favolaschia claudopus]|uniref:Uncharacterized protein n=1 Tax=Favolaschia claudopus TaxID=2862362 RepID=A0AAV9ZK82_9AGAR
MRGEAPISTVSRAQKPPSTVKNRVRGTIVRRLAYCREGSDRRGEGCAKRVSRTCQRDKWTNRPNVVGARLQGKEYACLRIKREVVGGTVLRAIAATTFLLFFVTSAPPAHLDSLQQLQRRRRNLLTSLSPETFAQPPRLHARYAALTATGSEAASCPHSARPLRCPAAAQKLLPQANLYNARPNPTSPLRRPLVSRMRPRGFSQANPGHSIP